LSPLVTVEDIGNHGLEFLTLGLVHHVRVIHSDHGAVGRGAGYELVPEIVFGGEF